MLKLVSLAIVLLTTAVSIEAVKTGTPHSTVQSLTKAVFRKAIQDPANGLWLLKFYAPWCSHCKKLAPVLEEVAVETTGRMAIGKIDCDKEKELCKEFNIKVGGYDYVVSMLFCEKTYPSHLFPTTSS